MTSIAINKNFIAAAAENNCTAQSINNFNEIIDDYKHGIAVLNGIVYSADSGQGILQKLAQFKTFLENGLKNGFSAQIRDAFKTSVRLDFNLFCRLIQSENLTNHTRELLVQGLADELNVCAPGVALNIEAAVKNLQALTCGLPHYFLQQLIEDINAQALNFIRAQKLCSHIGDEIHYVAALFNHCAASYGLKERTDSFIAKIDIVFVEYFKENIISQINAESVIKKIADNCLEHAKNFYAKRYQKVDFIDSTQLYTLFNDLNKDLPPTMQAIFAEIDAEAFFSTFAEDELYRPSNDSTLIAHHIAHKLREAGVLEEFKAQYLSGDKGEGLKLKWLGSDMLYASETDHSQAMDHRRQSLVQFIWQDAQRGKQLLQQLNDKALQNVEVMSLQQRFFKKTLPMSLIREMQSEPNIEKAQELLKKSVGLFTSASAKQKFFFEMLNLALKNQNTKIIHILASQSTAEQLAYQLSQVNKDGNTALMIAAENGQQDVIQALIGRLSPEQLTSLLHVQNRDGNTALIIAAAKGPQDTIQALIGRLSSKQLIGLLHIQNRNGYTALMLMLAARSKHDSKTLIENLSQEQLTSLLGLQDKNGNTALMHAIRLEQQNFVKAVTEKLSQEQLASLLGITSKCDATAFMVTARYARLNVIQAIIAKLSQEQLTSLLSSKDRDGCTALMFAAIGGHLDFAQTLIETMNTDQLAIQLSMINKNEQTMLMLALLHRQQNFAQKIIEGLSPEQLVHQLSMQDKQGQKLLTIALEMQQHHVISAITAELDSAQIESLLQTTLQPHELAQLLGKQNANAETTLMVALQNKQLNLANALIAHMSPQDLNKKNAQGQTALDIAKIHNRPSLSELWTGGVHSFLQSLAHWQQLSWSIWWRLS